MEIKSTASPGGAVIPFAPSRRREGRKAAGRTGNKWPRRQRRFPGPAPASLKQKTKSKERVLPLPPPKAQPGSAGREAQPNSAGSARSGRRGRDGGAPRWARPCPAPRSRSRGGSAQSARTPPTCLIENLLISLRLEEGSKRGLGTGKEYFDFFFVLFFCFWKEPGNKTKTFLSDMSKHVSQ